MKASKSFAILLVLLMLPAVASAQVVIERLNEDIDPSAPIIKPTEDDTSEDGGDVETGDTFTAEEQAAIQKVLVKQLESAHTTCLSGPGVKRPHLAGVTGSATWKIGVDGRAKYSEGSASPAVEMFFRDAKELKALKPKDRDGAQQKATDFYASCLKLANAKVPVKDKKGPFSVTYTVTWVKDKAVVEVNGGGGGASDEPDDNELTL